MSAECLPEDMLANCRMQNAILANVWDNRACIDSRSTIFNDLQSLLSKVPCCMKDTAKEIFFKYPEFAWSLVGILSASLVIGYAAHKYIECACNVTDIKNYVEEVLRDVDKYVNEAKEIVDDVFRSLSSMTDQKIKEIFIVSKMREAEGKLEAAEKMLIGAKRRIEGAIDTYRRNRNIGLSVTGLVGFAITGLSGVVGVMFPPAALVAMAGTALRVGYGAAAAVGAVSLTVWITTFWNSLQKISTMEGALLSTWEHYDRRVVEHDHVKKRLDEINSMIMELSKEDKRIAKIDDSQGFRMRFG